MAQLDETFILGPLSLTFQQFPVLIENGKLTHLTSIFPCIISQIFPEMKLELLVAH